MPRTFGIRISNVPGFKRFHFDHKLAPETKRYGAIALYQFGDLSCDSGFVLGPHKQACHEISYIVSGTGWFANDGVRTDLRAGDLFLSRPGQIHEGGVYKTDPFRYYYFGFRLEGDSTDGNPYGPIREKLDGCPADHCRDRLDIRTPFMGALKELNQEGRFPQTMLQVYLEQIVLLAYRNFCSDWTATYPEEKRTDSAKRVVYAAVNYIDNHILQIKDLKEVSDALGYSLSYLSHQFSKETGDSLRDYFAKRKWQKTVELLEEGGRTVTEIAEMMQYESIHTFSRAFRRAMGVSPTEHMRRRGGRS
jgi:AraC-like DNA-binding protein